MQTRIPGKAPAWLERVGRSAWLALALIILTGVAIWLLTIGKSVIIPLLLAAIVAAICMPLVDRLQRLHIPRSVAALIVVLALVTIAIGLVILIIVQIFGQAGEFRDQLLAGLNQLQKGPLGPDFNVLVVQLTNYVSTHWSGLLKRAAPLVVNSLSTIVALAFGIFIAVNILYYLLLDGRRAGRWLGANIGLPADLGIDIIRNSAFIMRRYFTGATIIAVFNGAVTGVAAVLLGSPLIGVIALVNFLTSYIPYVGAIVGGAIAVLLAMAGGDPLDGLWMLIVVILMNTVFQNIVTAIAMGAALKLHPLAVLLSTTAGGVVAGAIGSALGPPFVAVAIDALRRLRCAGFFAETPEEAAALAADAACAERVDPEARGGEIEAPADDSAASSGTSSAPSSDSD